MTLGTTTATQRESERYRLLSHRKGNGEEEVVNFIRLTLRSVVIKGLTVLRDGQKGKGKERPVALIADAGAKLGLGDLGDGPEATVASPLNN